MLAFKAQLRAACGIRDIDAISQQRR